MSTRSQILTLNDLPPAPPGKKGWPWTEATAPLPERMSDGSEWPRISIVTPSYNQGQFIEETIRSVLLQGYPNLEYIVIDGGSTDNSIEVIRKYEHWLTYWVSEPDRGQSHALNKGFDLATGKICAYINSDDMYLPGAFKTVVPHFLKKESPKWLGSSTLRGEDLSNTWLWKAFAGTLPLFLTRQTIPQQGTFWLSKSIETPYFDETKNYVMDYAFLCRLYLKHGTPEVIEEATAFYREHPLSKSCNPSNREGWLRESTELLLDLIEVIDSNNHIDNITKNELKVKVKKEATRSKHIFYMVSFLNENQFAVFHVRLRNFCKGIQVFIRTPYLFRDRLFFSFLIKLMLSLIKLNIWQS